MNSLALITDGYISIAGNIIVEGDCGKMLTGSISGAREVKPTLNATKEIKPSLSQTKQLKPSIKGSQAHKGDISDSKQLKPSIKEIK